MQTIKITFSELEGRAVRISTDDARKIAARVRGFLPEVEVDQAKRIEVTFPDAARSEAIRSSFTPDQARALVVDLEDQAARADMDARGSTNPIRKEEEITRDAHGEIVGVRSRFLY